MTEELRGIADRQITVGGCFQRKIHQESADMKKYDRTANAKKKSQKDSFFPV